MLPSRLMQSANLHGESLRKMNSTHGAHFSNKGWHFRRKLSRSFALEGTSGTHSCLFLEALCESLWLYHRSQNVCGRCDTSGYLKEFGANNHP